MQGFPAELNGHLSAKWDAQASYAYLDATLRSSISTPPPLAPPGQRPQAHPQLLADLPSAVLYSRQRRRRFPSVLERPSSTAPFDATTGLVKQAPGYWVFNAMIERPITEHASLHANVYNLADRYYYDQLHPSHIVLGPARSALIGIRFRF